MRLGALTEFPPIQIAQPVFHNAELPSSSSLDVRFRKGSYHLFIYKRKRNI